MKKLFLALAVLCGPLRPAAAVTPVQSANNYMVENTSGTDTTSGAFCYDFQTRPTCSARITNLQTNISSGSISPGSTNYIQNTATPSTATQLFSVLSGTITGTGNIFQTVTSTVTSQNSGGDDFALINEANKIISPGSTVVGFLAMQNNTLYLGANRHVNGTLINPLYYTGGFGTTVDFSVSPTATISVSTAVGISPPPIAQLTVGTNNVTVGGSSLTVSGIFDQSGANFLKVPSVQRFLSGSGTYSVPTSPRLPRYLKVTMVGPGGGGGGGGISGTTGGSNGSGATTFSAGTASAGAGGGAANGLDGGVGGTTSLTTGATIISIQAVTGAQGQGSNYVTTSSTSSIGLTGGYGGGTPLGSGATGALAGGAAHAGRANTGEGGGGGSNGSTGTNNFTGGGGGGGGYLQFYVAVSSAASYSYSIGTGGGGGNAGTGGGVAGATGGSGQVTVEELYQ